MTEQNTTGQTHSTEGRTTSPGTSRKGQSQRQGDRPSHRPAGVGRPDPASSAPDTAAPSTQTQQQE